MSLITQWLVTTVKVEENLLQGNVRGKENGTERWDKQEARDFWEQLAFMYIIYHLLKEKMAFIYVIHNLLKEKVAFICYMSLIKRKSGFHMLYIIGWGRKYLSSVLHYLWEKVKEVQWDRIRVRNDWDRQRAWILFLELNCKYK